MYNQLFFLGLIVTSLSFLSCDNSAKFEAKVDHSQEFSAKINALDSDVLSRGSRLGFEEKEKSIKLEIDGSENFDLMHIEDLRTQTEVGKDYISSVKRVIRDFSSLKVSQKLLTQTNNKIELIQSYIKSTQELLNDYDLPYGNIDISRLTKKEFNFLKINLIRKGRTRNEDCRVTYILEEPLIDILDNEKNLLSSIEIDHTARNVIFRTSFTEYVIECHTDSKNLTLSEAIVLIKDLFEVDGLSDLERLDKYAFFYPPYIGEITYESE